MSLNVLGSRTEPTLVVGGGFLVVLRLRLSWAELGKITDCVPDGRVLAWGGHPCRPGELAAFFVADEDHAMPELRYAVISGPEFHGRNRVGEICEELAYGLLEVHHLQPDHVLNQKAVWGEVPHHVPEVSDESVPWIRALPFSDG